MIFVFRIEIGLVQFLIVHVDGAAADFNDIAGHSDDTFDIRLRGIERIPEHDDIFACDSFDSINKLIDEYPFLIKQFRQHACAFDLNGLVKEDDDQDRRADCEKYITGPAANLANDRWHCSTVGLGFRGLF